MVVCVVVVALEVLVLKGLAVLALVVVVFFCCGDFGGYDFVWPVLLFFLG